MSLFVRLKNDKSIIKEGEKIVYIASVYLKGMAYIEEECYKYVRNKFLDSKIREFMSNFMDSGREQLGMIVT